MRKDCPGIKRLLIFELLWNVFTKYPESMNFPRSAVFPEG